jgi:tetratricopeptide (TPR) repeat protein
MQANKLSNRAPSSYADDWSKTPEIEIPQTGVSLSELQLALRNWLGRETRISGEVVRTPAGYQITARAGAEPGQSFVGTEAEIDATIQRAAQTVYRMTQPDRYAGWLAETGKRDEAAKLYQELSIQGSRRERAWALAEWAGLERDPAVKLARAKRAAVLDPEHPVAAVHIAQSYKELGRTSEALAAHKRASELLEGERAEELAPWWAQLYAKEQAAEAASLRGNHDEAARLFSAASEPSPDQPPLACSNCSSYAMMMVGRELARMHDVAGAVGAAGRAAEILPAYGEYLRNFPLLLNAYGAEDWNAALSLAERFRADRVMSSLFKQSLGAFAIDVIQAEALARTGRVDQARTLLAATPAECVACLGARGLVESIAGNARAAETWSRQAVRRSPDLPAAYQTWGHGRLARGDAAGALEAFRLARRHGRHWADSWKSEGDALTQLGKLDEAVRSYAEAAKRAPKWGSLHLAWGRALQRQGKHPEARARFSAAARMALSVQDRASLSELAAK